MRPRVSRGRCLAAGVLPALKSCLCLAVLSLFYVSPNAPPQCSNTDGCCYVQTTNMYVTAAPSALSRNFLQSSFLSSQCITNSNAFHMDGECDLKQRMAPPATATLPLPALISSSVAIDAPCTCPPRCCCTIYGLLQITQSLAAPSANTQSFDATIEVNGSTSVLGKSNLLLQGPASHFFPLVFAAHF
jgi:hypothetical protein